MAVTRGEPVDETDQTNQTDQTDAPIGFALPTITDADIAAVTRVLASGWITTGSECHALEAELAAYLGVEHVVALSSCTAALETAVAHLDLAPGSRIGVPTWTFVSTALSAVHAGLSPVLLDVEPDTLNLSTLSLDQALDHGLDAVIGVHFAGVAFGEAIHERCREAGIPLIEDAAHALGTSDHRGLVAGQGTAGACFSFYATKNLTAGEGGALATDDADLAQFARSFRLHGLSHDAWARYHPDSPGGYDLLAPGIKGNLPDILAALARSQLARFTDTQASRRALVTRYRDNLAAVEGLRFVPAEPSKGSADHLVVVALPGGTDRAAVVARMTRAGVGTSVHFQPLHSFEWFRANAAVAAGGTPVADAMAGRILSLPLHGRLSLHDIDRVCTVLVDSLRLQR